LQIELTELRSETPHLLGTAAEKTTTRMDKLTEVALNSRGDDARKVPTAHGSQNADDHDRPCAINRAGSRRREMATRAATAAAMARAPRPAGEPVKGSRLVPSPGQGPVTWRQELRNRDRVFHLKQCPKRN
jgi:hypothetical protein